MFNRRHISHFLAAYRLLDEQAQEGWLGIILSIHDEQGMRNWLEDLSTMPIDHVALVLQHRIDHEREKARKASAVPPVGNVRGDSPPTT